MSVFIARLSKKNNPILNTPSFSDYISKSLPSQPKTIDKFSLGCTEAVYFTFGAALDKKPIINEKEIIFIQGYSSGDLESRLKTTFNLGNPLELIDFPEAFCTLYLNTDSIIFGGSSVGVDSLFYYKDSNQLVVTNRHNLLGYWASSAPLRKESFAWMLGRSHIGDYGTYWQNIKKTRPGSTYIGNYNRNDLVEKKATYAGLYTPIPDKDIPSHINELSEYFSSILDNSEQESRLWLSGGKDSRAIAGLISSSNNFHKMTFHTFGENYSPDVMSSIKLA